MGKVTIKARYTIQKDNENRPKTYHEIITHAFDNYVPEKSNNSDDVDFFLNVMSPLQ